MCCADCSKNFHLAAGSREWQLADEEIWPENSKTSGHIAVETPFLDCFDDECDVEISGAKVPLQRIRVTLPAGTYWLGLRLVEITRTLYICLCAKCLLQCVVYQVGITPSLIKIHVRTNLQITSWVPWLWCCGPRTAPCGTRMLARTS